MISFGSRLMSRLSHRCISHYFKHPPFEIIIVLWLISVEAVRFALTSRCSDCKRWKCSHFEDVSDLSHLLSIDLNELHLVSTVPLVHILHDLVEIIQDVVAPRAILHVKVDENEFIPCFHVN